MRKEQSTEMDDLSPAVSHFPLETGAADARALGSNPFENLAEINPFAAALDAMGSLPTRGLSAPPPIALADLRASGNAAEKSLREISRRPPGSEERHARRPEPLHGDHRLALQIP